MCFGRGSFDACVYVSCFEVLAMLVRGWLVEAPSLLDSVLFFFGWLLVGVCRLSPWPWLPGPGVGSRFAFVFLVVLVSSIVFGFLVCAAFVDFAEIWYFGRFAAFSVLRGVCQVERFAGCSFDICRQ